MVSGVFFFKHHGQQRPFDTMSAQIAVMNRGKMWLNSRAEHRDARRWLWSKMSDLMEAGVSWFFSTTDREDRFDTLTLHTWDCVNYTWRHNVWKSFSFLAGVWWKDGDTDLRFCTEKTTLEDARSIFWKIRDSSLFLCRDQKTDFFVWKKWLKLI